MDEKSIDALLVLRAIEENKILMREVLSELGKLNKRLDKVEKKKKEKRKSKK